MDRLLPFSINIELIPGAKMRLVGSSLRQPKQQANVNTNYEELAVVAISRIRDAKKAI